MQVVGWERYAFAVPRWGFCTSWVHSSVVRAADCRSAGPWFKSGCALYRSHRLGGRRAIFGLAATRLHAQTMHPRLPLLYNTARGAPRRRALEESGNRGGPRPSCTFAQSSSATLAQSSPLRPQPIHTYAFSFAILAPCSRPTLAPLCTFSGCILSSHSCLRSL